MFDGAFLVLDGTQLADFAPPLSDEALTGAELLDLADSTVSSVIFGVPLPAAIKTSALHSIGGGGDVFRSSKLSPEKASETIKLYIAAIADALKDDPIMVAVLDGTTIKKWLEDEDEFAMIAENLFNDLDKDDTGKIAKIKIHNALAQMGVEMGVPPISECPLMNSVLLSNGKDVPEDLGQAQFAQLLQRVLHDLAEALADDRVVLVQNMKFFNDSKLRKILADEKQVSNIVDKILQESSSQHVGWGIARRLRAYLEKNGLALGLPPSAEANESVTQLYDTVFNDVEDNKISSDLNKEEVFKFVSAILVKFADQLEANPLYHDLDM